MNYPGFKANNKLYKNMNNTNLINNNNKIKKYSKKII